MTPNVRGQALIEMALFFLVLAPLIGLFLGFTRWFQIREKLVLAAWFGAELYSSGNVSPEESKYRLQEFLITGAPALDPHGITIEMGRVTDTLLRLEEIDRVRVAYRPPRPWIRALNLEATLEESCYVKHAPHYWDPFTGKIQIPNMPRLSGPEYKG